MDKAVLSEIEEIENTWITLSDGCRIAARIWMPKTAVSEPVPAVLEYIPYRKRDFMRSRDEPIHRYFALNGYAAVRVDIRGSGDSEGILYDEYTAQEHADAVEIIQWIASQPWCSGNVGMMGISWGGFNALQVAALRPEPLKAIITLCSTDDRYADDAHYMGGCLLNENMQWGSILMLYTALPPDPHLAGEDWRSMWKARLDNLEAFPAVWMRHPHRDAYWKHGSVCENYGAIQCPVYAIGGWADGYSNAVPRLMENLKAPKKGLIGPWAHNFPHDAVPGPSIGFLQEAVRWWDHWLKGVETGIMDEPALRIWMQESVPPRPQYDEWPGRWIAEDGWPSKNVKNRRYYLNPGVMEEEKGHRAELSFSSNQTTGLRGGEWCAFGADGEMARDQRPDDGGSLCFDTEPLEEAAEILGAPVAHLKIRCDKPVAMLAVRLCDVAPDGSSLRISYGLLNLAHRESHENPEELQPGQWYSVSVRLNDIAHQFPQGHRLRLAISTAYWPIAWPTAEAPVVTVKTAESTMDLPVRTPGPQDKKLAAFAPPEAAPGSEHTKLRHMPMRRDMTVDLTTNEVVYTLRSDGGEFDGATLARIEEIDLEMGYLMTQRHRIIENDPLSAQTEMFQSTSLARGDWRIRVECRTRLSATAEAFQFSADVEAFENNQPFSHRQWTLAIPRKLG